MATLHYLRTSLASQQTAVPSMCTVPLSHSRMTLCWLYTWYGTQLVPEATGEESSYRPRTSTMANVIRSMMATSPKHVKLSSSSPQISSWVPIYGARTILRFPRMHHPVNHIPCIGCGTGRLPPGWIQAYPMAKPRYTLLAWTSTSLQVRLRTIRTVCITSKAKV